MVKIKIINGHTMTVKEDEWKRLRNMFYQDRDPVFEDGKLKLFLSSYSVNSFLKHGIKE